MPPKPAKRQADDAAEPDEAKKPKVRKVAELDDAAKKKLVRDALSQNPPHVHVIGKSLDGNVSLMAGYLRFPDTDTFRAWLHGTGDDKRAYNILELWKKNRENNFGMVVKNSTANANATALTGKKLHSFLETEIPQRLGPLLDAQTAGLPIARDSGYTVGSPLYIYASWVTTMARLMHDFPDHFPDIRDPSKHKVASFAAEDCFRAFQVLRMYWRNTTGARAAAKTNTKLQNQLAAEPQFFTTQEAAAASTLDDDEMAPDQPHPAEVLIDITNEIHADDEDAETAGPVRPHEPRLDEKTLDALDKEVASRPPPDQAGKKFDRPLMSRMHQVALCKKLRSKVKVLHDAWIDNESHREDVLDVLQGALAAEQGLAFTSQTAMTEEERATEQQRFWDLHKTISTVSASTPTFVDAASYLGIDPRDPHLYPPVNGNRVSSLLLNLWQVMGAAWILQQEQGLIGGGIVADDCGVGKTVSTLTAIKVDADRAKAKAASGEKVTFRPTLILAPSIVVDVWFAECQRFFPDLLMYRYFETKTKVSNLTLRERVLPSNPDHLRSWLETECPSGDPATGYKIVVSSYSTWWQRTLKQQTTTGSGNAHRHMPAPREDNEVEEGDMDDSEAATLDPHVTYHNPLQGRFKRMILDESHKVKNPRTKTAHAAKLVEPDHTIIVTATPMINRIADLIGYLDLLFKPEWRVTPREWEEERVYELTFDLYNDDTLPQHTPIYNFGGELAIYQDAAHTTLVDNYLPLWRLDPDAYRLVTRSTETEPSVFAATQAHRVLRTMLPLIQLRRTMATEIVRFPGEAPNRIGDGIPHFRIVTVELAYSRLQQRRYDALHGIVAQGLYKGVIEEQNIHRPSTAAKEVAGGRSIAVHRQLSHATFNMDLDTLAKRVKKNLVKHVNKWYERTADRGMSFYWDMVKPVPSLPPYADRYSFGIALAENSPKLQYLAGVLQDACLGDEHERVLIMCGWPMTQWNCEGFTTNLGLETLSLRAAMTSSERTTVINRFNDPNDTCDLLVVSARSFGQGVNLQRCCAKLVIIDLAENVNSILQMIGRLHRLGQSKIQEIFIFTLDHSYDQVIQCNQTKKFLAQICGEAEINLKLTPLPTDDDGDVLMTEEDRVRREMERGRQILDQAEEKVRLLLGQRCSRASWTDHINLHAKDQLLQSQTPPTVRTVANVDDSTIPFTLTEKIAAAKASAVKAGNDAVAAVAAVAVEKATEEKAAERAAVIADIEKELADEATMDATNAEEAAVEKAAAAVGDTAGAGNSAAKKAKKPGGKESKKPGGTKNTAPKSKKKNAESEQGTDEEQVAARQLNGPAPTTRITRSRRGAS